MQVNDAVLTGNNTLVSCSSDTTVKVFMFASKFGIPICSQFFTCISITSHCTTCFLKFFSFVFGKFLLDHQVWNGLSEGSSTRTFRQHSDYVTCLASAETNVNSSAKLCWHYKSCSESLTSFETRT